MNILIKPDNFNKNYTQFLETKPNMLFDGLFTKINYCDEFMIMYGINLDLPIDKSGDNMKPALTDAIFNQFHKIETDLISEYLSHRPHDNYILTQKLTEFIRSKYDICESGSGESLAILKISGIWENVNGEIGLSFKLMNIS